MAEGGNGSETTNGISGVIKNADGGLAKNVKVMLISDTLNPVKSWDKISQWTVFSNFDGEYGFNDVPVGSYNIEFIDSSSSNKLLIKGIVVRLGKDHNVSVNAGVLTPVGELAIPHTEIASPQNGYLYIPGTSLSAEVDKKVGLSSFVIFKDVPSGVVNQVNFISDDSSLNQEVIDVFVDVHSNQSVMIDSSIWWESFQKPLSLNWKVFDEGNIDSPSNWHVNGKKICQTGNIHGPGEIANENRIGTYLLWNQDSAFLWRNYQVQIEFISMDNDGVGFMFRYSDSLNYYRVDMDADTLKNRGYSKLTKHVNGVEMLIAESTEFYSIGEVSSFYVNLQESTISILFNGEPLFENEILDSELASGTIALYSWGNDNLCFDDLFVLGVSR